MCLAYVCMHLWGTNPSSAPHSHITLGGIDAVVQRLNGHPAHGETPLGESGFEGLAEEEGPVSGVLGGRHRTGVGKLRLTIVFFT